MSANTLRIRVGLLVEEDMPFKMGERGEGRTEEVREGENE